MKHLQNYFHLLFFAVFLFEFGCSTTKSNKPAAVSKPESTAFAAPTHLTAELTTGDTNGSDAVLHWQNQATAEGGSWVEFATPGSEFTKLEVFLTPANVTNFVHPRLAPQTQFIYHIQPFFGKATAPVEIVTGIASTNISDLEEGPLTTTNAVAEKTGSQQSIKSPETFAAATPAELTATLSSPTSVDLRWKDRASDEDGFLVEVGAHPDGFFTVCALLPPDTTSFRKIGLPAETHCYFRIRAFFYGKPSDTAIVTTP